MGEGEWATKHAWVEGRHNLTPPGRLAPQSMVSVSQFLVLFFTVRTSLLVTPLLTPPSNPHHYMEGRITHIYESASLPIPNARTALGGKKRIALLTWVTASPGSRA